MKSEKAPSKFLEAFIDIHENSDLQKLTHLMYGA